MQRQQLKRELKRELTGKQKVFDALKEQEPILAGFSTVFDLVEKAPVCRRGRKEEQSLILKLIEMYRKYKGNQTYQQVLSGILLLVFWEDMQRLRGNKHCRYRLWRLGEPFAEIYYAYIELIATGNFTKGDDIRLSLFNRTKEFIKKEYKKQCRYEI